VQPLEVVVIDDGSTDNSVEVIESYAKKFPVIKFFRNDQNRGVMYTVNRGLQLVSSEYVTLLGADDEVMPGFIAKSLALLAEHPGAGLSSTIVEFRNMETGQTYHQGTTVSDTPCFLTSDQLVELSRRGRLILFMSTLIWRRDALLTAGGYLPELKWHSDWLPYITLALRHGLCFVPEVLGEFHVFPSSYSGKGMRDRKVQREVLKNILEALLSPQYKDILPYIIKGSFLAHFGKEMLALILFNKRYRCFLTLNFLKSSLWWIIRIEAKKVLPTAVAELYFRLAGHKVPQEKSAESVRNKVAKPAGR
jgi:glycosyltransferase involved in cell wall biosynthesis